MSRDRKPPQPSAPTARQRDERAAARLRDLRESEELKQMLERHVQQLQQANESLVLTAQQAQAMTENMRRAKDQLSHVAHHDFLTDLPNRMLLMARLTQALALARRHGHRVALLFIDLDRFKLVNDTLGHAKGDLLLKLVAQRLLSVLRGTDTASRPGGDEFVVVLTEVADERAVADLADKMLRTVAAPYDLDGTTACIGLTIGISLYPGDGDDADTLLHHADLAMYHGKHNGRNLCYFYRPEMNQRAIDRQRTQAELLRALEHGEFELHYQPRVNLASGGITGAEALLRWTHPQHGEMATPGFISAAEDCGLIVPIGHWVLGEACRQAKRWSDGGLAPGIVAVNISALEFRHCDFASSLRAMLAETGLPPHRLELEFTEAALMQDADASGAILRELKAMGVILAIDDFGTGYSNLRCLNRFPIDVLKIDRSFVHDIGSALGDGVIVGAVIALGSRLGRRVVAEGVEQHAQLSYLQDQQCAEGQGFLFSRPLPAPDFAELLLRRQLGPQPGPHC